MKRAALPLLAILALPACQPPSSDAPDSASAERAAAPAAYSPSSAQETAILAAVQRLFDALETGDDVLLRAIVDPSVVMHFSETRDGVTTFGSATLDGLATRITSSDVPLIERMWDPLVMVNGALATVWTPYDFYAGETFSHCGVDAANLLETESGWRIVALSWTRLQPPACSLHPGGATGCLTSTAKARNISRSKKWATHGPSAYGHYLRRRTEESPVSPCPGT